MNRLSIRWKLSIIYTIIAVATYVLANFYVIKTIEHKTNERTLTEMDTLVSKICNITESYQIKKEVKLDVKKAILTPSAYEQEVPVKKKEPIKYDSIPCQELALLLSNLYYREARYYIYVTDCQGERIVSTPNIVGKSLITLAPQRLYYDHSIAETEKLIKTKFKGKYYHTAKMKGHNNEYAFLKNVKYEGEDVFYFFKRTENLMVTIIAPLDYFMYPIDDYYSTVQNFMPIFFGVILIIGFVFIRYTLKPIDKVTIAASKMSVENLGERLPELKANDEISRLSKQLNAMLDRLEVSFNEVKRFTSDVSHELKTPLTILRGELEIALNADKDLDSYIMTIASSLDEVIRLQNVVESLLELSRADLGRVKLNPQEKSLTRLMIDIVEDAAILADVNGLSVFSKIEPDVQFVFDIVRIHQAIINITENAIKYNNPGGRIDISLWTVDDYAYIRVADTGVGIPAEKVKSVFDRFFRVDESRTRQGAGLGLSIVQWIVHAHDGIISVESEFGKGSIFEIRLPMVNQKLVDQYLEEKATQEYAAAVRAEQKRNKNILKKD